MSEFPKAWLDFAGLSPEDIPGVPEPAYPPAALRYNALERTSPATTRVVCCGQDPYHGPGQAHGLAFSVPHGVAIPPSLRNIYKELASDLGTAIPDTGNLESWADQGVLLLNSALSVSPGLAGSHSSLGWERVTDALIQALGQSDTPRAFVLWGNHAQEKRRLIDSGRHLVLEAPHPSPLSARRGFFGSRPFSRINAWLSSQGLPPIRWSNTLI